MTALVIMLLFFISLCISYRVHLFLFRRNPFLGITYSVQIDRTERLVGESFSFSQTVTNRRARTIPCLKLENSLPKGLAFLLPDGEGGEYTVSQVESVFCLPANSSVTRTWFVSCTARGAFEFGDALLMREDPLGRRNMTLRAVPSEGHARIRVLPKPEKQLTELALAEVYTGCYRTSLGLTPDLTLIRGVREYTTRDPFNRIHFKASAKLGHLAVRECEQLQNDVYNIVLNMQSRTMEPHGGRIITRPDHIEDCITVCASLFDSAAAANTPVSLIANIPTHAEGELFRSAAFEGQDDLLAAYRMLAVLPMEMSMPAERMLDRILKNPALYARAGHILLVSAYIDRRMLNFAAAMREQGVRVVFFITTSYQNESDIPDWVQVYMRYPNGMFEEVRHGCTA